MMPVYQADAVATKPGHPPTLMWRGEVEAENRTEARREARRMLEERYDLHLSPGAKVVFKVRRAKRLKASVVGRKKRAAKMWAELVERDRYRAGHRRRTR